MFIREQWGGLAQVLSSIHSYRYRFAIISLIVLLPCFWHRQIELGDLGSHTYNAWLVQLIKHGEISGLWIERQWSNVFFDFLLSGFTQLFGYTWGEKIAVSLAVLIFFWGAFSFVSAAVCRPAWYLSPLLSVIAYGWTFQMGFLNYYISLGLGFFGLGYLALE